MHRTVFNAHVFYTERIKNKKKTKPDYNTLHAHTHTTIQHTVMSYRHQIYSYTRIEVYAHRKCVTANKIASLAR